MRKIILLCTVACACVIPATGNSSIDKSVKADIREMQREVLIAHNGYLFGLQVREASSMATVMFHRGRMFTPPREDYPVLIEQDVRIGASKVHTTSYAARCVANAWLDKKPCIALDMTDDTVYTPRPRATAAHQ